MKDRLCEKSDLPAWPNLWAPEALLSVSARFWLAHSFDNIMLTTIICQVYVAVRVNFTTVKSWHVGFHPAHFVNMLNVRLCDYMNITEGSGRFSLARLELEGRGLVQGPPHLTPLCTTAGPSCPSYAHCKQAVWLNAWRYPRIQIQCWRSGASVKFACCKCGPQLKHSPHCAVAEHTVKGLFSNGVTAEAFLPLGHSTACVLCHTFECTHLVQLHISDCVILM